MSTFRTPLKRARGLGSAKDGVGHWWVERLTAFALLPLTFWFAWNAVGLLGADLDTARAFVGAPANAALLVLAIVAMFWHSALGVQVVIEDYVHHEGLKLASLVLVKFVHFALAAVGVLAVLRVALGG